MRQLTGSERIARDVAKSSSDVPYLADELEHYIFDMAFTAALDHTAAQRVTERAAAAIAIATLTQELNELRAEVELLREALFKAVKGLKRMVEGWRDHASGHYCQNYNTGLAEGLNMTADHLESYVNEAWRELVETGTGPE